MCQLGRFSCACNCQLKKEACAKLWNTAGVKNTKQGMVARSICQWMKGATLRCPC